MRKIDIIISAGFVTGLGEKYDQMLIRFYVARGNYEYRPLGDELRSWAEAGETEQVRQFCILLIHLFQNRKALLYEAEKFLNQTELNTLRTSMKTEKYIQRCLERVCPVCGSLNVARISYGLPVIDEELERDIKAGKIYLGGCCVDSYRYYCNICEHKF